MIANFEVFDNIISVHTSVNTEVKSFSSVVLHGREIKIKIKLDPWNCLYKTKTNRLLLCSILI